MKQLYKKLNNIKSKLKGNCEVYVETLCNPGKGMIIGVKWECGMYTGISRPYSGRFQQYFNEFDINKMINNKTFINIFIEKANSTYDSMSKQKDK